MNTFNYERLEQHWLFRYKFHHILFWLVYHFVWGVARSRWSIDISDLFFTPRLLANMFYILLPACAVYFNHYYLIPNYFEKGKISEYVSLLLLNFCITSLLLTGSTFLSVFLTGMPLSYFCYENTGDYYFWYFLAKGPMPATGGAMILTMSIKLAKNWLQAQKQQQLLEKEKLETELKFLKYQFNPHFLFNTINSIFFLIHKNPDTASSSLAKFSELLRYQLYECNEKQIPFSQEIAYLENFIALEKLRTNQNFELDLNIDTQYRGNLGIAPFILMTFVENAFKHVSKHKHKTNWVKLKLWITTDQELHFEVMNSKSEKENHTKDVINYGGIGLANVKRRLELLYTNQYNLFFKDLEDVYEVTLQLKLTELPTIETFFQENKEMVSQV